MATVKAKKKRTIRVKRESVNADKKPRRLPFPPLPRNADGQELSKYTSALVIDVEKESLPPEQSFFNWLHYWESAVLVYEAKFRRAEKMIKELGSLTPDEIEERRTGIKALKSAQKAVKDETVQTVFAETIANDPAAAKAFMGKMTPEQLMAFMAMAQASLTQ